MQRPCWLAMFLLTIVAGPATAQRDSIIILNADRLAKGNSVADEPTPGKWWLRTGVKDATHGGKVLQTGRITGTKGSGGEWKVTPADRFVGYRVPPLVINPKVKGWWQIYVGLLRENVDPYARLFGKISGEPYPEYLQAYGEGKSQVLEVYWKTADLTGKKIILEQPPAPMPHPGLGFLGGVSHIKLVGRTEGDVRDERTLIELPPKDRRLFGLLDYTDEVFWWGTAQTEDDMRAIVYRHRQAGFGRIYWRCWGSTLDNSLAIPEANPRWTEKDEERWCKQQNTKAGWFPYINLCKKFDPLKVAALYGQKNDCEVHAWVRFTNLNREPYANFWHDHPEFRAQMVKKVKDPKTGAMVTAKPYERYPYPRVLSMAYPEVRAFYVRFFKQLASTGTRGILIDLLRHPPIAGYEPIVSEAFKKKYGKDMEELDVFGDPLVNEHLSQYLRQFLIEMRKELGTDIEIGVRCRGPHAFAFKGKEWIAEGLINTIVDGNWYSGNGPRPTIAATVEAAGTKGQAFAIAEPGNVDPKKGYQKLPGTLSAEAILALGHHYSGKGVHRFGLYESTEFTYYPELRHAIRAAGWAYEPGKK